MATLELLTGVNMSEDMDKLDQEIEAAIEEKRNRPKQDPNVWIKNEDRQKNEFGLNERQEEFCQHYVNTTMFDAELAFDMVYKAAEVKNKRMLIRRLMENKNIKKRLRLLMGERDDVSVVDKYYVLKKLKEIVDTNEKRPAYQLKALELLGKHLGLFGDRVVVQNETTDPSEIARSAFEERIRQEKIDKGAILKLYDKTMEGGEESGNINSEVAG